MLRPAGPSSALYIHCCGESDRERNGLTFWLRFRTAATVCAPSTCVRTRARLSRVRDAQPDLLITRVARNIRSVRVSQRHTNFNKFRLRSGVTCAYSRAGISIKSKGNRIRRSPERGETVFHEAFSRPRDEITRQWIFE